MKTTSPHTPTPWFVAYLEDGTPIIDAEYQPHGLVATIEKQFPQDDGQRSMIAEERNARFIVEACNSHVANAARIERLENALRAAGAIVSEYATEQRGFADQIISPRHAKQSRLDEAQRAERVLVEMSAALALT